MIKHILRCCVYPLLLKEKILANHPAMANPSTMPPLHRLLELFSLTTYIIEQDIAQNFLTTVVTTNLIPINCSNLIKPLIVRVDKAHKSLIVY